jgi:outer membrane protein assembly factor BamB
MLHALVLCSLVAAQQEVRAVSPDQRSIVVANGTKVDRIDAASQKVVWSFQGGNGNVTALAFAPDGRVVGVGTAGNEVRALDAPTGKVLWNAKSPAAVIRVTFSPDGKSMTVRLVTQAEIKLDSRTGEVISK